jgi:hypothetical protein
MTSRSVAAIVALGLACAWLWIPRGGTPDAAHAVGSVSERERPPDEPNTRAAPPRAAARPKRAGALDADALLRKLAKVHIEPPAQPDKIANGRDPSEDFLDEAALQARWSTETPDPAWASDVQTYLRETSLAAGLDSSVVQSAECATTLCRLQLRFLDWESAAAFDAAAQNPSFDYRSTTQSSADAVQINVYLLRKGWGK